MAKAPPDRFATCAALMNAAEAAFDLRQPVAFRRRRRMVIGASATMLLLAATLVIAALLIRDRGAAAPVVRPDSLVRIDPATNKVDAVIGVGERPVATAISARSIWVYSDPDNSNSSASISEVDPATDSVRRTTRIGAASQQLDVFSGPVIAADSDGAWLVGGDARRGFYLTRVFSGSRGTRAYRLDQNPRAVAVGYGAVWVITRGKRDEELLRIDPSTGNIAKRFRTTTPIDSLTTGLGSVWVVASSAGAIFRIDPYSLRRTGVIYGGAHLARPEVMFGSVWIGESGLGGDTFILDPRASVLRVHLGCCSPKRGYFAAGNSSIWTYDAPTGTVERWDGLTPQTHHVAVNIHVTDPPFYGGLCLTSIATIARAVWVTVSGTLSC